MNDIISHIRGSSEIEDKLCLYINILCEEGKLSTREDRQLVFGRRSVQRGIQAFNRPEGSNLLLRLHSFFIINLEGEAIQSPFQNQTEGEINTDPVVVDSGKWITRLFNNFWNVPQNKIFIRQEKTRRNTANKGFTEVTESVADRRLVKFVKQEICLGIRHQDFAQGKGVVLSDSIKLKFIKESFHHIKSQIKEYIQTTSFTFDLRNIVYIDTAFQFESIIRNENNAEESTFRIRLSTGKLSSYRTSSPIQQLKYYFGDNGEPADSVFIFSKDANKLSWILHKNFSGLANQHNYTPKEIAKFIWNDWLKRCSVF